MKVKKDSSIGTLKLILLIVVILVVLAIICFVLFNQNDNFKINANFINSTSELRQQNITYEEYTHNNETHVVGSVQLIQPEKEMLKVFNSKQNPSVDKVSTYIKKGTFTRNGATIIIEDRNERPFAYNHWYKIEKKEKDEWNELKMKKKLDHLPGERSIFSYDGISVWQIDWSEHYGELKNGIYRIVKKSYDINGNLVYIYTEFEIN